MKDFSGVNIGHIIACHDLHQEEYAPCLGWPGGAGAWLQCSLTGDPLGYWKSYRGFLDL